MRGGGSEAKSLGVRQFLLRFKFEPGIRNEKFVICVNCMDLS